MTTEIKTALKNRRIHESLVNQHIYALEEFVLQIEAAGDTSQRETSITVNGRFKIVSSYKESKAYAFVQGLRSLADDSKLSFRSFRENKKSICFPPETRRIASGCVF